MNDGQPFTENEIDARQGRYDCRAYIKYMRIFYKM